MNDEMDKDRPPENEDSGSEGLDSELDGVKGPGGEPEISGEGEKKEEPSIEIPGLEDLEDAGSPPDTPEGAAPGPEKEGGEETEGGAYSLDDISLDDMQEVPDKPSGEKEPSVEPEKEPEEAGETPEVPEGSAPGPEKEGGEETEGGAYSLDDISLDDLQEVPDKPAGEKEPSGEPEEEPEEAPETPEVPEGAAPGPEDDEETEDESFNLDDISLDDFKDISPDTPGDEDIEDFDLESFNIDDEIEALTSGDAPPSDDLPEDLKEDPGDLPEPGGVFDLTGEEIEDTPGEKDTETPSTEPVPEVSEPVREESLPEDESPEDPGAEEETREEDPGEDPSGNESEKDETGEEENDADEDDKLSGKRRSRVLPVLILLILAGAGVYYYHTEVQEIEFISSMVPGPPPRAPEVPEDEVRVEPSRREPAHPLAYYDARGLFRDRRDGVTSLTYEAPASLGDVRAYYRENLSARDYSITVDELRADEEYAYMVFTRDGRDMHIILREESGRVSAYLSYLD